MFAWEGGQVVIVSGVTHLGAPPIVPDLEAFQQPTESGVKLCRPCGDVRGQAAYHDCDGHGCECAICAIAHMAQEMNEDWEQRDREMTWPTD